MSKFKRHFGEVGLYFVLMAASIIGAVIIMAAISHLINYFSK
jgi:hypothetical protein